MIRRMAEEPKDTRKQVRGHCPNCGPARFAEIVAEYADYEAVDDEQSVALTPQHALWRLAARFCPF